MMSGQERDELEREKRGSLLQLMFRSARILNDVAIEQVRRTMGLEGLRPAHTALFPHIDLEGTRLTELARRLGISKQAVGQLVDELEEMGGLERVPDPVDGRAKLVRFRRRKGRLVLFEGLEVLGKLEAALEQAARVCELVVCTHSGDPVKLIRGAERAEVPVERITPVDATGAGDQFAAGFLYGMATDRDLETAGRMGVAAASEVIRHIGPRPKRPLSALFAEQGLI